MDFVDFLTRGNVSQVKTVLASIVTALALYQVALMAVGYGKVRIPFLRRRLHLLPTVLPVTALCCSPF